MSATESERVCTRTWRSERTKTNARECNGKGDDMRLRNIPRAEGVLQAHPIVIKEENNQKGKWNQIFGNDHPIYIEIGMGKGQFLMTLA